MIERKKLKTSTLLAGMAAAGLLSASAAQAATPAERPAKERPAIFALSDLPSAILVAGEEGSCGEGKCGEGNCGDGGDDGDEG